MIPSSLPKGMHQHGKALKMSLPQSLWIPSAFFCGDTVFSVSVFGRRQILNIVLATFFESRRLHSLRAVINVL
jgi:hypothetical protein